MRLTQVFVDHRAFYLNEIYYCLKTNLYEMDCFFLLTVILALN